jgi:hypothetical protein
MTALSQRQWRFPFRKEFSCPNLGCYPMPLRHRRIQQPSLKGQQMGARKIIPLAQQPDYKKAMSKVVDIGRALSQTTALLERSRSAIHEIENRKSNGAEAIDRAMALVGGSSLLTNPIPQAMSREVERLESEQRALRDGLQAANQAAEDVARQLSRDMGMQASAAHVEAVKSVREALTRLCEANKAEESVRMELSALGYDGHGLPHGGITQLGDIDDWTGSPAYYYMRETAAYVERR